MPEKPITPPAAPLAEPLAESEEEEQPDDLEPPGVIKPSLAKRKEKKKKKATDFEKRNMDKCDGVEDGKVGDVPLEDLYLEGGKKVEPF